MAAFLDAGITTFDCADIYTGVEEHDRRASARGSRRSAARRRSAPLKVHTKFVPDWTTSPGVDAAYVRGIVERSLQRLRPGAARPRAVPLVELRACPAPSRRPARSSTCSARARSTASAAPTSTRRTRRALLDAGVPLVSHAGAVLAPRRAARARPCGSCARNGASELLCYGTVAGGFLSERWLGAPEPASPFANRSLTKYKLIIDDFGGWDLFQALLRALEAIADRHGVGIAAVATRWVLDRPQVAGAIVGARYAEHLPDNLTVFAFALDDDDRAAIARGPRRAAAARRATPSRSSATGRAAHGRIMKYNLNRPERASATAAAGPAASARRSFMLILFSSRSDGLCGCSRSFGSQPASGRRARSGAGRRRCGTRLTRAALAPHAEEAAERASRSTRASPARAGSSFETQPAAAPQDEGGGSETAVRADRVRLCSHFVLDCCPKLCCWCAPFPSTEGRCREALRGWGGDRRLRLRATRLEGSGGRIRRRSGPARPIAPQRPVRPILRWGPGRTSLRPRPGRTIQRPAKPGSPDGRRAGVRGRTGQKSPDVPGQPGRGLRIQSDRRLREGRRAPRV